MHPARRKRLQKIERYPDQFAPMSKGTALLPHSPNAVSYIYSSMFSAHVIIADMIESAKKDQGGSK